MESYAKATAVGAAMPSEANQMKMNMDDIIRSEQFVQREGDNKAGPSRGDSQ
uniref:Uncharacterized protein n=1 Tax=Octopus bimaculoides TaxID=37653 RepID=A0A0L8GK51_OCTBM